MQINSKPLSGQFDNEFEVLNFQALPTLSQSDALGFFL